MNIDTDTMGFWDGVIITNKRKIICNNINPEGSDKPNKNIMTKDYGYEGEKAIVNRLKTALKIYKHYKY